jgi:hypothetical protein
VVLKHSEIKFHSRGVMKISCCMHKQQALDTYQKLGRPLRPMATTIRHETLNTLAIAEKQITSALHMWRSQDAEMSS